MVLGKRLGLIGDFPGGGGILDSSCPIAFRMGEDLDHSLDQILAEDTHLYSALPCRCSSISRRKMALIRLW